MLTTLEKEDLKDGIEVIGFHPDWISEYNPKGFRIGYFSEMENKFISAKWCGDCDSYENNNELFPEKWFPLLDIRNFMINLYHEIKHGDDEHIEWLAKKFEDYYNKEILS